MSIDRYLHPNKVYEYKQITIPFIQLKDYNGYQRILECTAALGLGGTLAAAFCSRGVCWCVLGC
jgi:hypothetical protein